MDVAHLKGVWNGVMLTLSFKHVNNNIAHVATAVCEKQNAEEYNYLLQNVMEFHEIRSVLISESTSYFTDGHKGSRRSPGRVSLNRGSLMLRTYSEDYPSCRRGKRAV